MELAIFAVVAVAALAGTGGVIVARKAVHAAMSLVMSLLAVAVFFVMQDAHFLAAVQVIVYAGAIVILFLFVIMLLGTDAEEKLDEPLRAQRPLAIVIGVGLFAGLIVNAGILRPTGAAFVPASAPQVDLSNVERLALTLFTDFLWPFEITSVLLVIAVVGGVVLARPGRPRAEPEEAEEIDADPDSDDDPVAAIYAEGTAQTPGEHDG